MCSGKGNCRRQWRKSRRDAGATNGNGERQRRKQIVASAPQDDTDRLRGSDWCRVASARPRTRRDDGERRRQENGKCTIAAQWRGRAILFDLFPPDGLSCRGGTETRVANPEGRCSREVGLSLNVLVLAVVFG